jgi:hypothetical protein
MSGPRPQLKLTTEGRFLCVAVTNLGAPAMFSGIVQPGRGTASAALAKPALWHHSTDAECRIETGQSASFRIAQRDRPAGSHEDDDRKRVHPEGPQAWRMCFLKRGIGSSLDRICAVIGRDTSSEHNDGVVLTVMSDPPLPGHTIVKSISLEGDVAIDLDTGDQFRVLDSPRHYHARDPRTL